MPTTKLGRRAFGAFAIVFIACLSVYAVKGTYKPFIPSAPEFRQKGDKQAKVVIAEFSDFQCPSCAAAMTVLKNIESAYGTSVRVVYKHFPLERHHLHARQAARAVECAGRQGRFWELGDLLFSRQLEWSETTDPDFTLKYAAQVGLDTKALQACLADPAIDAAIDADKKEGEDNWVGSTPTFFINGKRFVGGRQLSILGSTWIEKQLVR